MNYSSNHVAVSISVSPLRLDLFKFKAHFGIGVFMMLFLMGCGKSNSATSDEDPNTPIEEEALAFLGAEGFGRKVTGGRGGRVIKIAMRLTEPHDVANNVTTHSAQEAYEKVLQHAGASLKRDDVDIRIINDVRNGSFTAHGSSGDQYSRNGIIDRPHDVGGWPVLNSVISPKDTDNDGMPDDWEIANNLDPQKPNANGRDLSTAYDNIEVYINSLTNPVK